MRKFPSIFIFESVIAILCGRVVASHARESRSQWARLFSAQRFLAKVDLPEPELPKMSIFLIVIAPWIFDIWFMFNS